MLDFEFVVHYVIIYLVEKFVRLFGEQIDFKKLFRFYEVQNNSVNIK